MVTRCDLSIFVESEKLAYPHVTSYMTHFQPNFASLPTCFFTICQMSKGSSPNSAFSDVQFFSKLINLVPKILWWFQGE